MIVAALEDPSRLAVVLWTVAARCLVAEHPLAVAACRAVAAFQVDPVALVRFEAVVACQVVAAAREAAVVPRLVEAWRVAGHQQEAHLKAAERWAVA